jgi:hypothetical protein
MPHARDPEFDPQLQKKKKKTVLNVR